MALSDPNVDETMAADWARIRDEHTVEETPEPVKEPATEPEPEAPAEPVADTRVRDETGKFVKQDTPEKAEKAAPVEAVPDPPAEVARDINRPPSTWKPTARAEWEKLSPAVRAEIHRRETDFMTGQGQLLPDARFGKSMTEVIQPYRMLIESEGGTPERAVADLLRTAALFRIGTPVQKQQALAGIAQQFGIQMPQQGQQAPAQDFRDPRVDGLLQHLQTQDQQRQAREQQDREATVTTWMNEVDAKGQPKRPYLGDVMGEMSALVPQLRERSPSLAHAEVLQRAYETATWGNPEIRALLQQATQGVGQVREADNQNRVREAKRAASVNVPRRASLPSAGQPGKMEETIAETARELGLIT